MKFGVKLWSTNTELIKQAKTHYDKGDFDYIELSAIIETYDGELLDYLKGIPVIIHCDVRHNDSQDDVNFADVNCFENNIKAFKEAQKFADYFNSEVIIVHPGHNGTYEAVNNVLAEFNDSRICVENMPGKSCDLKYECLGRTKEELMKINVSNYCLDVAHAIKAAKTLKYGPYELIEQIAELKPKITHVSDGNIDSEVDEHLNIGEGDFEFPTITSIVKGNQNIYITLETPKTTNKSLNADVCNIKDLIYYLNQKRV